MQQSLDDVMLGFAEFLSASWGAALHMATTMQHVEAAGFMSDWLQANWEILVEMPFRQRIGSLTAFLDPYGEGADCNDPSSRVWLPEALPTHQIVCRRRENVPVHDLLTGGRIDATSTPVIFDHFAVRSQGGWHDQAPPFDCVLGYHDDQEVLILLDHLLFVAEKQVQISMR